MIQKAAIFTPKQRTGSSFGGCATGEEKVLAEDILPLVEEGERTSADLLPGILLGVIADFVGEIFHITTIGGPAGGISLGVAVKDMNLGELAFHREPLIDAEVVSVIVWAEMAPTLFDLETGGIRGSGGSGAARDRA